MEWSQLHEPSMLLRKDKWESHLSKDRVGKCSWGAAVFLLMGGLSLIGTLSPAWHSFILIMFNKWWKLRSELAQRRAFQPPSWLNLSPLVCDCIWTFFLAYRWTKLQTKSIVRALSILLKPILKNDVFGLMYICVICPKSNVIVVWFLCLVMVCRRLQCIWAEGCTASASACSFNLMVWESRKWHWIRKAAGILPWTQTEFWFHFGVLGMLFLSFPGENVWLDS